MANRSYLYSLSNRPTSYADRPETISGLGEWAYAVPFSFRVLMSADPQLCASLISDGFDGEPPDSKTKLYAISSEFEPGYARLKKFIDIVRALAEGKSPQLLARLDDTETFLEAHRDRFLLLETIELDSMDEDDEAGLRKCVEWEIKTCRQVGAAIDALPADITAAGRQLSTATKKQTKPPLDTLFGLVLDDDFDNFGGEMTDNSLGLSNWSDVLFFELWNRAKFEENR